MTTTGLIFLPWRPVSTEMRWVFHRISARFSVQLFLIVAFTTSTYPRKCLKWTSFLPNTSYSFYGYWAKGRGPFKIAVSGCQALVLWIHGWDLVLPISKRLPLLSSFSVCYMASSQSGHFCCHTLTLNRRPYPGILSMVRMFERMLTRSRDPNLCLF